MSEITCAKTQFIEYLKAFNQLEPSRIPAFFYLPSLLMTPNVVTKPMTTVAEVEAVFTPFMADLKKRGFSESELKSLSEKMLSDKIVIFSGSAIRYKKEGETKTELEKLGFTYTLRKDDSDDTWKIIMGVIHDFSTAIALEP
ncbi:MAG: hypothetical protein N5P05_004627 (plasmid) [Chroococcopsis gigantea SAG 12.99]|jgi:hypothetical protein|nr:hypothetical protein [Chroococcopsis gigantea SAG 12.99]